MNNSLTTTGVQPICIGSVETFQTRASINGLPWDLTGGSATLLMTDPAGGSHTYAASIIGGSAQVQWTVVGPPGLDAWLRAWELIDASGRKQISRPIVFSVIPSPS